MRACAMHGKSLMRRSAHVRLLIAVVCVAVLSSVVLAGSTRVRPEVTSLAEGLEPLKQAFAANDGRPRYIAVVSPT